MDNFASLKECEQYIERINADVPEGELQEYFLSAKGHLAHATKATEKIFNIVFDAEHIWAMQCKKDRTIPLIIENHFKSKTPHIDAPIEVPIDEWQWINVASLLMGAKRYNNACILYETESSSSVAASKPPSSFEILTCLLSSSSSVVSQYRMMLSYNEQTATSKIMTDLGKRSGKKFTQAKEVISEIAQERWDEGEQISVGAIAEQLMKFINAAPENLGLDEPPKLSTVIDWLRPIAPPHARKAGRPKKS